MTSDTCSVRCCPWVVLVSGSASLEQPSARLAALRSRGGAAGTTYVGKRSDGMWNYGNEGCSEFIRNANKRAMTTRSPCAIFTSPGYGQGQSDLMQDRITAWKFTSSVARFGTNSLDCLSKSGTGALWAQPNIGHGGRRVLKRSQRPTADDHRFTSFHYRDQRSRIRTARQNKRGFAWSHDEYS